MPVINFWTATQAIRRRSDEIGPLPADGVPGDSSTQRKRINEVGGRFSLRPDQLVSQSSQRPFSGPCLSPAHMQDLIVGR